MVVRNVKNIYFVSFVNVCFTIWAYVCVCYSCSFSLWEGTRCFGVCVDLEADGACGQPLSHGTELKMLAKPQGHSAFTGKAALCLHFLWMLQQSSSVPFVTWSLNQTKAGQKGFFTHCYVLCTTVLCGRAALSGVCASFHKYYWRDAFKRWYITHTVAEIIQTFHDLFCWFISVQQPRRHLVVNSGFDSTVYPIVLLVSPLFTL